MRVKLTDKRFNSPHKISFKQSTEKSYLNTTNNTNNEQVKVSVVVPVFKATLTQFQNAYNSLLKQTLKNIQFILIDSNMPNDSFLKKIISSLKSGKNDAVNSDERVKICTLTENHGPGHARNVGINNADGKYIGFMDTDDIIEPTMFETLYSTAESNKSDLVVGCFQHFENNDEAKIIEQCENPNNVQTNTINDNAEETRKMFLHSSENIDLPQELLNFAPVIWNKLYNKKFLADNNIVFPESYYMEDTPFTLKSILNAKNLSFVDKLLYHYRYSMTSLSDHTSDKKMKITNYNLSPQEENEQKNRADLLFKNVYKMLLEISNSLKQNPEQKTKVDNFISYAFSLGYKKTKVPQYYLQLAQTVMKKEHYTLFKVILKMQNIDIK